MSQSKEAQNARSNIVDVIVQYGHLIGGLDEKPVLSLDFVINFRRKYVGDIMARLAKAKARLAKTKPFDADGSKEHVFLAQCARMQEQLPALGVRIATRLITERRSVAVGLIDRLGNNDIAMYVVRYLQWYVEKSMGAPKHAVKQIMYEIFDNVALQSLSDKDALMHNSARGKQMCANFMEPLVYIAVSSIVDNLCVELVESFADPIEQRLHASIDPDARALLEELTPLWTEEFAAYTQLVADMSPTGWLEQSRQANRANRLVHSVMAKSDALKAELARLNDELAREKLTSARNTKKLQATLAEQQARISVLEAKLASAVPATPGRTADAAYTAKDAERWLDELRETRKKTERLAGENETLSSQLAEARQFIALLTREVSGCGEEEPSSASHQEARQSARERRIVVVGGHQRVHAKLRRELPKATFLHPDASTFPNDTFEGADGVLFCVNYLSHKLSERAMQEVRRLGLRMGYTSVVNIDRILESVDQIFAPIARAAIEVSAPDEMALT